MTKSTIAGIRFKQVEVGQWSNPQGTLTYTVIGLTDSGQVFTYNHTQGAWVPLGSKIGRQQ